MLLSIAAVFTHTVVLSLLQAMELAPIGSLLLTLAHDSLLPLSLNLGFLL
jgi:hypothetical protein